MSLFSAIARIQDFARPYVLTLLVVLVPTTASAELQTYTLVAPLLFGDSYLVNQAGQPVHHWQHEYGTATSSYLLDDGSLLRTSLFPGLEFRANGQGGVVERLDWDGNVVWTYKYVSEEGQLHHDIQPMPNGNVLMIAWSFYSREEAIAAGRDPDSFETDELWPDSIIEVRPSGPDSGEIVWQWNAWDHLVQDFDPGKANYGVVADHPELIDINYLGLGNGGADWHHANAINYNPELDQIVLSVLMFSEIWIIDHSTTTEEAAGHSGGRSGKGGDLLFRWGNPQAYGRGTLADRQLFGQHDAEWIRPGLTGAGNILVFNNGRTRPEGAWSSVEEITTSPDASGNYPMNAAGHYLPNDTQLVYQAEVPEDFYAPNTSGAQRLHSGNTLITNGPAGAFFEVTTDGEIVREFEAKSLTQTNSPMFRSDDYTLSSLPPSGLVLDGSISGSWFNPERDGEGWVVEVLENGLAVLVWFTYPDHATPLNDQEWITGVGYVENDHIVVESLETLSGSRFGSAFDAEKIVRQQWGRMEVVFSDCNNGTLDYSGREGYGAGSTPIRRLSQIDQLDCEFPLANDALLKQAQPDVTDNTNNPASLAGQAVSGSFFQPQRDGEGWLMENLGDGRALAYWFTFNPQGESAWLLAVGEIGADSVVFDDVQKFSGTAFGDGFDPKDIGFEHWGHLEVRFDDCDTGSVSYQSVDPAWGSGEIDMIRLTTIAGTTCDEPTQ